MFAKQLLSVLLLSGSLLSTAHAKVSLDFSNEYNTQSIHAQGDMYFIDKVKELTAGSVDITLHTGGSLGFKSADHFYAVSDNAVPLADTLAGTMAGINPIFLLSSLPFIVKNEDEAQLLYKIAKPYYEKVFTDNNEILLYASPWPASGIWSKSEVETKQELDGLKIRTYDKNGTLTFKNAGAAPVNLSWADVVPQLSTGGINAVLTSADAGASARFWEQLNSYSAIQYAIPLNMVHMNKDEFDALDEKQQAAILEAAKLTDEHNWKTVRTRVADNYKELKQNKVTILTDLPKPFMDNLQTSAKPALSDWLKETGDVGKTIMDEFEQQKM
ncbi:TRAP transporter substrate-binding protein [Vibrio viridaestus]|uniref:C4-dicarboxylate ABC transporter substrate-binding protein n=1 Tax=Vibrio viridaestus TaxID=2487322 RepID=A0A3N9U3L0_9VIBR|nr:TRAP transporter substrate-binding protein [Vibrio viridaestus]RQW62616.1 C4-dicarboxylate ABC transporter substrate-binding protein [Vibrio viridaestus]